MKYDLQGYKFWLDSHIDSNMNIFMNEAIPNNWDGLFIISGGEGSGKTYFTSQISLFCDHRFTLYQCVFTPSQFNEVTEKCPPESSIMWDEAIQGAMSEQHATEMQMIIIKKLTQIRKKRLKIFLCFPYLFMLRRYFIERALCGFHIYAKGFDDRGYGKFYSSPQLLRLQYLMKEKYKYNSFEAIKECYGDFQFRFDKTFCLPEKEYDIKKEEARTSDENASKKDLGKYRAILFARELHDKYNYSYDALAKMCKISKATMADYLKLTEFSRDNTHISV